MSKFLGLQDIPVDQIEPNPKQPRPLFNDPRTHTRELGQDILERGQIFPICLTPRGSKYRLVRGEKRWFAAKEVGIKTLKSEVWELTDIEVELFHTCAVGNRLPQIRGMLSGIPAEGRNNIPAEDTFLVETFHEVVGERIKHFLALKQATEHCPKCYTCPKAKNCSAYLSFEEFAKLIDPENKIPKCESIISHSFARVRNRGGVKNV